MDKTSTNFEKILMTAIMADSMNALRTTDIQRTVLDDNTIISTVGGIADSDRPFQTAVMHKDYDGGMPVIVEEYNTTEQALVGHNKWKEIMSRSELPATLIDVSTCQTAKLYYSKYGEQDREKRRYAKFSA